MGYVEGVPFVAYGAGCDVVILSADFQRVQIIPGATHGNVQITCLDCSHEFGKIAASYGPRVCIFEPLPNLRSGAGGDALGSGKANAGMKGYNIHATNFVKKKGMRAFGVFTRAVGLKWLKLTLTRPALLLCYAYSLIRICIS